MLKLTEYEQEMLDGAEDYIRRHGVPKKRPSLSIIQIIVPLYPIISIQFFLNRTGIYCLVRKMELFIFHLVECHLITGRVNRGL